MGTRPSFSVFNIAISDKESYPTSVALADDSSEKTMEKSVPDPTTCLFVTIYPSLLSITPLPCPESERELSASIWTTLSLHFLYTAMLRSSSDVYTQAPSLL